MSFLRFTVVGVIAGIIGALPLEWLTHLILRLPNVQKAGENLEEFLGLLGTLLVMLIVYGYKRCHRSLARRGVRVRFGFAKAALIGLIVSTATYIALSMSDQLVASHVDAHPILWFVIFVSTILSLWMTMPDGLREAVGFLQTAEIIEEV